MAGNGDTALAMLRESGADLVLCDLGLPGIIGYELAERIREDDRWREVPLIALTGYGQAEDRTRTHASGFDAHLVKPAGLDALDALIDRFAEGRAGDAR